VAWKGDSPDDPLLQVFHLLDGQDAVVELYRAVKTDDPTLRDFTSAFALGSPPPRRLQKRSAPVWMALSTYQAREQLEDRMKAIPQIGTHVARLELQSGQGFALAETVEAGHVSLWGDPLKLANSVVDVYPVG
jgi:hypothetical protein